MNIFLFIILSFTYTHMTLSIFIITPPAVATKVFILKKKRHAPCPWSGSHACGARLLQSFTFDNASTSGVILWNKTSPASPPKQRSSGEAPLHLHACVAACIARLDRRLGRRARRAQQASGHPPRMHGGWLGAGAGHAPRARSRDVRITHACAAAVRTWGFPHAWLTTKRATGKPVTRGVH